MYKYILAAKSSATGRRSGKSTNEPSLTSLLRAHECVLLVSVMFYVWRFYTYVYS